MRTLRHSDIESLPKATELLGGGAKKGDCLQHLCSLLKRKNDSLTEEGLEDHVIKDGFQM